MLSKTVTVLLLYHHFKAILL